MEKACNQYNNKSCCYQGRGSEIGACYNPNDTCPYAEKYVYCIHEECHGLIGIWDDETLARKEVDRLSENYENIEPNDYFWNNERYGNDMVCYERVKLNVPW